MTEEEKSERLFSQLTAAWYNWAVSKMLYERRVHCWALTTAYYSMMHAARTLMDLTTYWDERFVRFHEPFLKFLEGEELKPDVAKQRIEAMYELSAAVGVSPSEVDETFHRLHEVLDAFKVAREMTSYERYVIAHQVRSDIQASLWLDELSKRAFDYVSEVNIRTGDLVFKYLERSPSSAYHLHHLKQEIEQFHGLLQKENLVTPNGVDVIVKRFEELIDLVPEPKDMRHFIENTIEYRSKNESYDKLHSALVRIRELQPRQI